MARGLPKDVRLTCVCGAEFLTTRINVLGLCPACVTERARRQRLRPKPKAVCVSPDSEPGLPHSGPWLRYGYEPSGPAYGFASLGDVFMANDGRLIGRRLRMDRLRMPQVKRPRGVFE